MSRESIETSNGETEDDGGVIGKTLNRQQLLRNDSADYEA